MNTLKYHIIFIFTLNYNYKINLLHNTYVKFNIILLENMILLIKHL